MPNRRREAKFKYCQIPDGEDLLAVLGSAGIKTYGLDEVRRTVLPNHFHNLLEIGICRQNQLRQSHRQILSVCMERKHYW